MTKEEFNQKVDRLYERYKDAPIKEIKRLPWPFGDYVIKRKEGKLKKVHQ